MKTVTIDIRKSWRVNFTKLSELPLTAHGGRGEVRFSTPGLERVHLWSRNRVITGGDASLIPHGPALIALKKWLKGMVGTGPFAPSMLLFTRVGDLVISLSTGRAMVCA